MEPDLPSDRQLSSCARRIAIPFIPMLVPFPIASLATELPVKSYDHMPTRKPPPTLHPMKDFDPSEPAILHDLISDRIITWSGEDAAAFHRAHIERADGTVAWNEFVFDGWGNVLGG